MKVTLMKILSFVCIFAIVFSAFCFPIDASESKNSISYDFTTLDKTKNITNQISPLGFTTSGVTIDFGDSSSSYYPALRIKNYAPLPLTAYDGSTNWANYTMETTLCVGKVTSTGATKTSPYSGIEFGVNASAKGFEWTVASVVENSCKARLYDRINGKVVSTVAIENVATDTPISMKVVLKDNIAECYINGTLYYTYTATEKIVGTVGLYSGATMTTYTNMSVSNIEVVESGEGGGEQGGEQGGETDDFVVPKPIDYSFSASQNLTTLGFSTSGVSSDFYDSSLRIRSSNACLRIATLENCYKWKNYTIESTFVVSGKNSSGKDFTDGSSNIYAGIEAACNNSGKGLSWTLAKMVSGECTARLYDYRNSVQLALISIENIDFDKPVTFKISLQEDTGYFYINNVLYFTYKDKSVLAGSVGLKNGSTMTLFKNVKISASNVKESVTYQDGDIMFKDDFSSDNWADNWFCDGNIQLDSVKKNLYSNGTGSIFAKSEQNAFEWSEYRTQCDVVLTGLNAQGNLITDSDGEYFAGIAVGTTTGLKGFELRIVYENGEFLATIFDSVSNRVLGEKVKLTGIEFNKSVKLELKTYAGRLIASVNDEEVINVKSSLLLSGTSGIVSGGGRCLFDNFTIYKYCPPQKEQGVVELINSNFNNMQEGSSALLSSEGWKVNSGKFVIKKDAAYCDATADAAAYSTEEMRDGMIEADISIDSPGETLLTATAKKTDYNGNLRAKLFNAGDLMEIRTRFAVTKNFDAENQPKYTAVLQTVIYNYSDWSDHKPKVYNSAALSDFDFGKSYHVCVKTIGNYIAVYLDQGVVFERSFADNSAMPDTVGRFGVFVTKSGPTVSYDNIRIVKYNAKSLTFDESSKSKASTDSYSEADNAGVFSRNRYYPGEFVKLSIFEKSGYVVDEGKLYYTYSGNTVPISAKDNDWLYGFYMPESDAVIHVDLKKTSKTNSESGLWFSDKFDKESLMVERGWSDDSLIKNGRLVLDSDVIPQTYLTGINGSSKWSDYVLESYISLDSVKVTGNNGVASISIRSNGPNDGYEFGEIIERGKSKGYFRLYDRTHSTLLAKTAPGTAVLGKTYRLTVIAKGNNITCYVNDEKTFDINGTDVNEGTIGLRAIGSASSFDNVSVRTIDSYWLLKKEEANSRSPLTGDVNSKCVVFIILNIITFLGFVLTFPLKNAYRPKRYKHSR